MNSDIQELFAVEVAVEVGCSNAVPLSNTPDKVDVPVQRAIYGPGLISVSVA